MDYMPSSLDREDQEKVVGRLPEREIYGSTNKGRSKKTPAFVKGTWSKAAGPFHLDKLTLFVKSKATAHNRAAHPLPIQLSATTALFS